MKHVLAGLVLAFLTVASAAAQDFEAERKRIRRERAEVQERFEADEKACYRRFAVTDCLDAARKQRNAGVADLRRQEVALNDSERKRRAVERQREVDAGNVADRERARPVRADPPRPRAPERKLQAPGVPRATRVFEGPRVGAGDAARNQQAFEARRRQAGARKAAVLERNAKRGKAAAADLPPPP